MQEELSPELEIAITQLQLTVVLTVMAYLQKFRRVTNNLAQVNAKIVFVFIMNTMMQFYDRWKAIETSSNDCQFSWIKFQGTKSRHQVS